LPSHLASPSLRPSRSTESGHANHECIRSQTRRRHWRRAAGDLQSAKAKQVRPAGGECHQHQHGQRGHGTAAELKSPAIIQFSNGGAQFFAGKGLDNDNQRSCIAGAVSGAKHIHQLAELYGATVILHTDHAAKKLLPWIDGLLDAGEQYFKETGKPLFSSHMLDLSEESLEENIEICCVPDPHEQDRHDAGARTRRHRRRRRRRRQQRRRQLALYTQPEDVAYAYERLSKISNRFTIAASFGNVHGVYKPGNVKLQPIILKNSQKFIRRSSAPGARSTSCSTAVRARRSKRSAKPSPTASSR
jgi:hypothetical protein